MLSWITRGSGFAALAQLVEHRIRNAGVTSSSLVGGTTRGYSASFAILSNSGASAHCNFGRLISVSGVNRTRLNTKNLVIDRAVLENIRV